MILGRFLDHRESVFNQASAAQMSGFLQKPSGHRSLTVAPFEPSELETHGTHGTHPAKTIRWISLEVGGILPTQLGDSSSTKSVIYLYESPIYIYINIYFANFLVIHHWIWNFTHFGFFLWLRVAHFETSFESSFKTFQSHSIREIHG